jgi:hypothetical protein
MSRKRIFGTYMNNEKPVYFTVEVETNNNMCLIHILKIWPDGTRDQYEYITQIHTTLLLDILDVYSQQEAHIFFDNALIKILSHKKEEYKGILI